MKLFNIYTKQSEDEIIKDLEIVKYGFSYMAFFFNIFWFLQHKMWRESITLFFINIIFAIIFQKGLFGVLDAIIIELGLSLIIGLNARYWYEQHLKKHHYKFVGCVFGKNQNEAKLRFISNCFKNNNHDKIFCPSITDLKPQAKNQEQYFTV